MTFKKPWPHLKEQNSFNEREVGITHPDNDSFIRIRDGGDIEIGAGQDAAMVFSPRSNSITIFADHVKFVTRHDNGIRVNDLALNESATHFDQPTFLEIDDTQEGYDVYHGVDYYLDAGDNEIDVQSVANDVMNVIANAKDRRSVE